MGAGASRVLPPGSKPTSNPRLILPEIKFLNQMELRKMLFMGAISGSPLMVLHAVEMGQDPGTVARATKMTPLHFAARYGNEHCIDILVKSGAKVNVPQKYGWRPIHEAAMNGHAACIEVLLEFGSRVNARTGRVIRGNTPLHYAARHGHLDCVKVLIENNAEVNRNNEIYETPLVVAAMRGHTEIMEYLLDHGANIKARSVNNYDAAYVSTQVGDTESLKMLISRGINLEAPYHDGLKLLHIGVVNARKGTLLTLLEAGAEPDSRTFIKRLTPLHYAARHGQTECVKILIDHGADVHARCSQRYTPLHYAARKKQKQAAQFIIDAGADINAVTGGTHETPLHFSLAFGDRDLMEILVKKGADVNIPDCNNKTVLDHAWDDEIRRVLKGEDTKEQAQKKGKKAKKK